jgi:type VI secretion system secreted protein Hcp
MAFDAYLFIDGVEGEAQAKFDAKPNGISSAPMEIFSFSFGASNPTSVGTHSGGMSAGKVSVSSLNIMKRSDDASPKLFQMCCEGDHVAKASLVLRKAGGKDNKQSVFLQYDLEKVYVDSIQWSGSSGGDDTPTESVSIAFGKVTITNFVQDTAKGGVKKGNGASWDLTKAVA